MLGLQGYVTEFRDMLEVQGHVREFRGMSGVQGHVRGFRGMPGVQGHVRGLRVIIEESDNYYMLRDTSGKQENKHQSLVSS